MLVVGMDPSSRVTLAKANGLRCARLSVLYWSGYFIFWRRCETFYVSLIRKKFRWGTIFLIGLKRYRDPKEELIEKEPLITKGDRAVDRLSNARSRPGPTESDDSCEGKVKPKRGPS
ncbi:hypothetical protein Tco_1020227 [Tanacetum coccineum]|uniref:Uncharacterized protein n=1 Tax=Tanacetum coccineum TaxID=301880 RepID=A0ABQ5FZI2_9ASTR